MSTISSGTTSTTTLIHSGDTTGSLVFKTNDTGSGGTTAMTIDTSQNVGIGTSSPASKLDVQSAQGVQKLTSTTGTNSVYQQFVNTGGSAYVGLNNSTGADFGNSAYALQVYHAGAYPIVFATSNTERMRIDSSGNLLIGATAQNATEKFNVTTSTTEVADFINSSNTSGYNGVRISVGSGGNNTSTWHLAGVTRGTNTWYLYGNGTTSYSSDSRLKKNIETTRDGYLEDVAKLRVVKYNWHNQEDTDPKELGLIAQEVEQVFPNLIQEHEIEGVDGTRKHIKHSVMEFILIKAIQELKAEFDAYKAAHP